MKKLMVAIAALVFVVGCGSKKVVDETNKVPTEKVDATPMGFDAAGSDSGKIDGLVTVQFEYDKANLSAEAKKQLAGNADWIKKNAKTTVQIEGHCDSRGTIEYNLALGERRAQAVKKYLVGLGITGDRLSVISYGEEKPAAQGETEDAWTKNRRANFLPMAK